MPNLSPRESQVLTLWLSGIPQKRIALDLGLSTKTVNTYKMMVMRKLNAENDIALVLTAIDLKILKHPCKRKSS